MLNVLLVRFRGSEINPILLGASNDLKMLDCSEVFLYYGSFWSFNREGYYVVTLVCTPYAFLAEVWIIYLN